MNWQDHIAVDPAVLVGKPIVKGRRQAVEFVLDLVSAGWREAEILRNYLRLRREDILGVLSPSHDNLASHTPRSLDGSAGRLRSRCAGRGATFDGSRAFQRPDRHHP